MTLTLEQVYKDQMARAGLTEAEYFDLAQNVNPFVFVYYLSLLSCEHRDPMLTSLKAQVLRWLREPTRKFKSPLSPKQEPYIVKTRIQD